MYFSILLGSYGQLNYTVKETIWMQWGKVWLCILWTWWSFWIIKMSWLKLAWSQMHYTQICVYMGLHINVWTETFQLILVISRIWGYSTSNHFQKTFLRWYSSTLYAIGIRRTKSSEIMFHLDQNQTSLYPRLTQPSATPSPSLVSWSGSRTQASRIVAP